MTLTPVGDYLRKRYPPNDGATHWLGQGDDPGCCAGSHPACLYPVAWAEALRSLAAELEQRAEEPFLTPPDPAGLLRFAAQRARTMAGESPS